MPSKEAYARQKARGGAEFLRKEVERNKRYVQQNREAFNERRRHNFRHQLNRIKKQAKDRGYKFELDEETVRALLKSDCVYCGAAPDPFNTIDRADNTRGYELGNVVSSCNTCNLTKVCLDPNTYIERCKHIAFVHTGEGEAYEGSWAPTRHASVTMAIYQRSAKKKGLAFELTQEQFDELTGERCTYCRQPTTDVHRNGIDRIESDRGYVRDNCVTCCGQCNVAKKKLTRDEFIEHARKVAATPHPDFSGIPRCTHIITRRPKM